MQQIIAACLAVLIAAAAGSALAQAPDAPVATPVHKKAPPSVKHKKAPVKKDRIKKAASF